MDDGSSSSVIEPIIRTPNKEKYAKIFAADYFREQGYEVVVYDYPIFDYDLEIMKGFEHCNVIVRALDYKENEIYLMKSDLDLLRNYIDRYKVCIVKMTTEGNPYISVISIV